MGGGGGGKGGGKKPQAPPQQTVPQAPATPTIDTAALEREKREKDLAEREAKRKRAIAESGRASTILAGEDEGDKLG